MSNDFDDLFKKLNEQKEKIDQDSPKKKRRTKKINQTSQEKIQEIIEETSSVNFKDIYENEQYIYYVYRGQNLELMHLKIKKIYNNVLITINSDGIYQCIDVKEADMIFQTEYDAEKVYKELKDE